MHERIYVCHTFYHVYVACLKEFHRIHQEERADKNKTGSSGGAGQATLVLSAMSNHFDTMIQRARNCGIFEEVIEFDEKEDTFFPELKPLRTNTDRSSSTAISKMVERMATVPWFIAQ